MIKLTKSKGWGEGVLNKRRNIFIIFIAVNAGLLVISVAYAVLFTFFPALFECRFKELFHLYCPGCGGSRAVISLLSLDIVGSFIKFPPLYVAIAAVAELDVRFLLALLRNDPAPVKSYRPTMFIVFAAVLILHFFLRNFLLLRFGIDPLGDLIPLSQL